MNINWPRAVARRVLSMSLAPRLTVFCAIFCASLISMPAVAQDSTAAPSSTIQIQDIVARPIPQRTVGLTPGKVVKWYLRDAIEAALEKNIDIELERENVRMMQYDLIAAQGFYDPTATSRILYNSIARATALRDQGLDGGNTITNKSYTYNFGMTKNLERGGGFLQADFFNFRSSSNTSQLSTEYTPQLVFQFSQPLFRDYKIDQGRRNIKVAKKRLDLTDAQFRQRVIQIISDVTQAYWNLSLAIKNEAVQRESVSLAETFLNNTKRQAEVGTLALVEVVSAASALESRRQSVFQAMNNVGIAENTLKNLTASGPNDELWSSLIEPLESFDAKSASVPVQDAINLAHENRPEIRQQSLTKEINKIDIDLARNQAKPQIDLIASYRTDGLGGTPGVTTGTQPNCGNPTFLIPGDNSSGVCNSIVAVRDASGNFVPAVQSVPFNPAVPFTRTAQIDDKFTGGYGTALGNLFKNQFRTWSVGVQISLPLRNRTAKANLGRFLEQDRQIDLQTRQLMQRIEVEVRNAVQAVETAKMRIDAAEAATKFARQQLDGEEKKFAAGLQPAYFVLERQNQLSVAQISELQAKADYNIAIANLQRVMSTTLTSNSIELKQEAPVRLK
ncbi:MAG TPA: TolC family protein [Blastocatellia bacterium]|nr:TolC family protein [Blastocatellia bacterium]